MLRLVETLSKRGAQRIAGHGGNEPWLHRLNFHTTPEACAGRGSEAPMGLNEGVRERDQGLGFLIGVERLAVMRTKHPARVTQSPSTIVPRQEACVNDSLDIPPHVLDILPSVSIKQTT